jgi:hypothetical protein
MPCVALSTGKASINVDWQRYSIARDASAANAFHDLADSAVGRLKNLCILKTLSA